MKKLYSFAIAAAIALGASAATPKLLPTPEKAQRTLTSEVLSPEAATVAR